MVEDMTMRILVTGGSGFVGSHSVAALTAAGHHVRVMARSPAKVTGTLEPLGTSMDAVEVVEGDLLDHAAVERAIDGMDAVLHAASVYSLDIRRAAEIDRVNLEGTKHLLHLAAGRKLDPIVHVSSVAALWRQDVPVQALHADAPVGDAAFAYSRSKAEQERMARRLQEEGAPVVTVYPGQVLGPGDPHEGVGTLLVRSILRGELVMCPRGDIPVVDVRDLADLHARLFEPGKGHRRHVMAQRVPVPDLVRLTLRLAGRSLPVIPMPDRVIRGAGRAAGWLQHRINQQLSFGDESSWIVTQRIKVDMSSTERLGVHCRPLENTIADQLAWQKSAGRL
jgi:dihydroflavonol-4-reductase